ncbi:hypothetical protein [Streptomyces sp. NBC_01565]|uniref:hypothetical protein n=1 Tax=Streptomyces sp. NBC_01565 TaxID=2975881 RepID=UPI002251EC4A|nr:hypothetical protein [Streptomyces sp. NBC_01565]MCX4539224.1 hypothetical protein [Streptomyces sp. NBC_01565]
MNILSGKAALAEAADSSGLAAADHRLPVWFLAFVMAATTIGLLAFSQETAIRALTTTPTPTAPAAPAI